MEYNGQMHFKVILYRHWIYLVSCTDRSSPFIELAIQQQKAPYCFHLYTYKAYYTAYLSNQEDGTKDLAFFDIAKNQELMDLISMEQQHPLETLAVLDAFSLNDLDKCEEEEDLEKQT